MSTGADAEASEEPSRAAFDVGLSHAPLSPATLIATHTSSESGVHASVKLTQAGRATDGSDAETSQCATITTVELRPPLCQAEATQRAAESGHPTASSNTDAGHGPLHAPELTGDKDDRSESGVNELSLKDLLVDVCTAGDISDDEVRQLPPQLRSGPAHPSSNVVCVQFSLWALEELKTVPLASATELLLNFKEELLSPQGIPLNHLKDPDYKGALQLLVKEHHRNRNLPVPNFLSMPSDVHPISQVGMFSSLLRAFVSDTNA